MSPIEHVWDLVGRRLTRDPRLAASKDELLLRIHTTWSSLPQDSIQNLFDSMPQRIADFPEVINSIVVVKIPNPTDISLVWVPF
ncbi:transposable element Tcb1 transposase [Trichonephila clavipes]|nr:transposable element Tcb1 transposase [Trichonephila clavipes]